MIPLALLFIDFLAFGLLQNWLIYSTFAYLITTMIQPEAAKRPWLDAFTIFAFLLHDFAMHGRFGLGLIFLVPAWLINSKLKDMLLNAGWLLIPMNVIAFFVLKDVILYFCLDGCLPSLFVTSVKIFITIGIGYVVFWGMRGNRSPITQVRGGRKVWTPSRMDASQEGNL